MIISKFHFNSIQILSVMDYQWNAGKYNSGIYLVMVKTDDKMYQKRLVVVKK